MRLMQQGLWDEIYNGTRRVLRSLVMLLSVSCAWCQGLIDSYRITHHLFRHVIASGLSVTVCCGAHSLRFDQPKGSICRGCGGQLFTNGCRLSLMAVPVKRCSAFRFGSTRLALSFERLVVFLYPLHTLDLFLPPSHPWYTITTAMMARIL
jgi:hypothetical protein